jgi:hypothetical protein
MGCNSQPDSQSENPDSAEGMIMESRMCSAHRFYLCEWGGTWTVKTNILASYWELKGRPGN